MKTNLSSDPEMQPVGFWACLLRGFSPAGIGALLVTVLCLGVCLATALITKDSFDRAALAVLQPTTIDTAQARALDDLAAAFGYGGVGRVLPMLNSEKAEGKGSEALDPAALASFDLHLQKARQALQTLSGQPAYRLVVEEGQRMLSALEDVRQAPQTVDARRVGLMTALPLLQARMDAARQIAPDSLWQEMQAQGVRLQWLLGLALLLAFIALLLPLWLFAAQVLRPLSFLSRQVRSLPMADLVRPLFGVERADAVGEAARALDAARQHFATLPDISLLTDEGAVRARFEGQAAGSFAAVMQTLERSAALLQDRGEALARLHNLAEADAQQWQKLLPSLADQGAAVATASSEMQRTGLDLTEAVQKIEERAKGMGEIIALAGNETARALQGLLRVEKDLDGLSKRQEQRGQQLAQASHGLAEQLQAAVVLLRAGGKVMAEGGEAARTELSQAVSVVAKAGLALQAQLQGMEERLAGVVAKAEAAVTGVSEGALQQRALTQQFEEDFAGLRRDGAAFADFVKTVQVMAEAWGARQSAMDAQLSEVCAAIAGLEDKSQWLSEATAMHQSAATAQLAAMVQQAETQVAPLAEQMAGLILINQKLGDVAQDLRAASAERDAAADGPLATAGDLAVLATAFTEMSQNMALQLQGWQAQLGAQLQTLDVRLSAQLAQQRAGSDPGAIQHSIDRFSDEVQTLFLSALQGLGSRLQAEMAQLREALQEWRNDSRAEVPLFQMAAAHAKPTPAATALPAGLTPTQTLNLTPRAQSLLDGLRGKARQGVRQGAGQGDGVVGGTHLAEATIPQNAPEKLLANLTEALQQLNETVNGITQTTDKKAQNS